MRRWRHRHRYHGGQSHAGGAIQGFLEPCLLLRLNQCRSYGYDLVNSLEPFGLGYISPGPVYRMLREMEGAGLVRSEWDTSGGGGPPRRVYEITAHGRAYLREWIEYLRETSQVLQRLLSVYDQSEKEGGEKNA